MRSYEGFVLGSILTPDAPAGSAFTEVGSGTQRARFNEAFGATSAAVFPANVQAGSLMVATGTFFTSDPPAAISVTDSLGNTWTVLRKDLTVDTGVSTFIAYMVAPAGGANTVTFNSLSGPTSYFVNGVIDEFRVPNAAPLSVNAALAENAGTNAPTQDITTLSANELIIGVVTDGQASATGSITEQDGTLMAEDENGSDSLRFSAVFVQAPTASLYTINWTQADSTQWGVQLASFKSA